MVHIIVQGVTSRGLDDIEPHILPFLVDFAELAAQLQEEKSNDPFPKWEKEEKFSPTKQDESFDLVDSFLLYAKFTISGKTRTGNIKTTGQIVEC